MNIGIEFNSKDANRVVKGLASLRLEDYLWLVVMEEWWLPTN
jgi:hypothetical protein